MFRIGLSSSHDRAYWWYRIRTWRRNLIFSKSRQYNKLKPLQIFNGNKIYLFYIVVYFIFHVKYNCVMLCAYLGQSLRNKFFKNFWRSQRFSIHCTLLSIICVNVIGQKIIIGNDVIILQTPFVRKIVRCNR